MNSTEEQLRETLQRHVQDAPHVSVYAPTLGWKGRFRSRWIAPIAVAAVTAVLVGGIAWLDRPGSAPDSVLTGPNDGQTSIPDIRGLTGKEVGEALGLEPMSGTVYGCEAFAEYVDGVGFCYEQWTWPDRPASYILGNQINGDAPTPADADYLAAVLELHAMNDGTIEYNAQRETELITLISELQPQLSVPTRRGDLPAHP